MLLVMSFKTAKKPKKKPSGVVHFGYKKTEPIKILAYGKGYEHDAAIRVIDGGKVYGATKLHEVGHEVKVDEPSIQTVGGSVTLIDPVALDLTSPEEQESELAGKLVAKVAADSADVKALCEDYQLKREELGRLTGFSLRALAEWAGGKLPSQPAKRRLQEVRRLLDALSDVVERESIPQWLHKPNPAFDRLTPLQVIEIGEIDRLWAMVHDLASGQPE